MRSCRHFSLYLLSLFLLFSPRAANSIEDPKKELSDVGIFTQLGTHVDLNLQFQDTQGKTVTLQSLMRPGIPVIIVPVYYGCPRLCGFVINAVVDLVNAIQLTLGKEFQVITVSFDTTEKSELAAKKSDSVMNALTIPADADRSGWHFLVGDDANVAPLMNQLAFRYKRDGAEFAHSSGIMILTPQGEISQYLTGIEYPPWDVKLALVEASKGGIGSALDHALLFCFRFDPTKGKYTWVAFNSLRIGVLLFVMTFGWMVYVYSQKVRKA